MDPAFSLRRFAQSVGISATFLSKVETGEFAPPAPDKIKKMAELLGLDADELLAQAGRIDPDLEKIIRGQPREVAAFLRTVRDKTLSGEKIDCITNQLRNDDSEE